MLHSLWLLAHKKSDPQGKKTVLLFPRHYWQGVQEKRFYCFSYRHFFTRFKTSRPALSRHLKRYIGSGKQDSIMSVVKRFRVTLDRYSIEKRALKNLKTRLLLAENY